MKRVPFAGGSDSEDETPRMTKEQKMQKYTAVFDSLDTDRSGFLSSDELLQAVIALVNISTVAPSQV